MTKLQSFRKVTKVSLVTAGFGTLLLLPVAASAASDTDNSTINATLGSTISMTTSGTVAISVTPTAGGSLSSASDTVTVSTNNATGYQLDLEDADTNTNLVNGANNIAASADTPALAAALANDTWGFAIASGTEGAGSNTFDASYSTETNAAGSITKWAGITSSAGTAYVLKDTATTASGDATTVWYAVEATTAKPNGTYSDTVTYTATTN